MYFLFQCLYFAFLMFVFVSNLPFKFPEVNYSISAAKVKI